VHCFYHQERDAVGSCKSCGKGVCSACAVDLGKGLACRGRCEDDVKAVLALVEENLRMVGRTPRILRSNRQSHVWAAVLFILLGAAFLAWGLLSEAGLSFLVVLGGIFLAYGLLSLARVSWMPSVPVAPEERPASGPS
jgi:hypothetical protein